MQVSIYYSEKDFNMNGSLGAECWEFLSSVQIDIPILVLLYKLCFLVYSYQDSVLEKVKILLSGKLWNAYCEYFVSNGLFIAAPDCIFFPLWWKLMGHYKSLCGALDAH